VNGISINGGLGALNRHGMPSRGLRKRRSGDDRRGKSSIFRSSPPNIESLAPHLRPRFRAV